MGYSYGKSTGKQRGWTYRWCGLEQRITRAGSLVKEDSGMVPTCWLCEGMGSWKRNMTSANISIWEKDFSSPVLMLDNSVTPHISLVPFELELPLH